MLVEAFVWSTLLANSAQLEGFWVTLLGGIIAAFGAQAGIIGLSRLITDVRECDDPRKVRKMFFRGGGVETRSKDEAVKRSSDSCSVSTASAAIAVVSNEIFWSERRHPSRR